MPSSGIKTPSASRHIAFHQLLVAARKTWLMDALKETVGRVDPKVLKNQLGTYVPADAQKILASSGVRDDHVFPAPVVLETKPTLVGYYRLLLGVSQKTFYASGTGMGQFKSMEMKGVLNKHQKTSLPTFCKAMSEALAELVRQMAPTVTARDVHELPLLALGAQFQGGNNTLIGKRATADVFLAIAEIVKNFTKDRQERKLVVKNASGRTVVIALGADPDVRIEEDVAGTFHKKLAIEIKGGTDKSNAHNRAGEAEKSHIKAKREGFAEFWTVISKKGLKMEKLRGESPSTNLWFDVAEVLGRDGADWNEFRNRLAGVVGIPL